MINNVLNNYLKKEKDKYNFMIITQIKISYGMINLIMKNVGLILYKIKVNFVIYNDFDTRFETEV